jgi:hypothetical protein
VVGGFETMFLTIYGMYRNAPSLSAHEPDSLRFRRRSKLVIAFIQGTVTVKTVVISFEQYNNFLPACNFIVNRNTSPIVPRQVISTAGHWRLTARNRSTSRPAWSYILSLWPSMTKVSALRSAPMNARSLDMIAGKQAILVDETAPKRIEPEDLENDALIWLQPPEPTILSDE